MPEDWEYVNWDDPPETWDMSVKPYKEGEPLPDYMCVNMLSFPIEAFLSKLKKYEGLLIRGVSLLENQLQKMITQS
jgi:hypothetical protein